jgi:hypothetical protein
MFVSCPTNRVEYAHGRSKGDSVTRGCHELLDGFLVVAGLAEYLSIENCQLVFSELRAVLDTVSAFFRASCRASAFGLS